jgi:alpha-beta hydrolase superfamily lysophospholipase
VKLVEEAVKQEQALSPKKPIYLVGDSLGGCLALAVAARNPTVDLVLILVNPGESISVVFLSVKFVRILSGNDLSMP